MFQHEDVGEVLTLLRDAAARLSSAQREALERALITPRRLLVEDSPGEFVVAVAAFGDKLLYWSDVEEGWELVAPSSRSSIASRGCNQFELTHVLNQVEGSGNAA